MSAESVIDLITQMAQRPQRDRGFQHLNASALTSDDPRRKFCGRAYALARDLGKQEGAVVSTPLHLSVTYAIGYFVQDYVVKALKEHLIGDWWCPNCKKFSHLRGEWFPRVRYCPDCDRNDNVYTESRLVSKTTGASGGFDAIVRIKGVPTVIEVKSIDKDKFKELKTPLWEHTQRTSLYLRILEDSDWFGKALCPRVDEARIIYVSKGGFGVQMEKGGPFTPLREFVVSRDDSLTDAAWEKAHEAHQYLIGKTTTLPDRVCEDMFDERASVCPFSGECFGAKKLVFK